MTIEQIDENLAKITAEYIKSQRSNNIQVPEGRFNSPDSFLGEIVQEGQDNSLTDGEIKNAANEIRTVTREFTQENEQNVDEVSING